MHIDIGQQQACRIIVPADHQHTVPSLLKSGKYDWASPDIKRFRMPRSTTTKVRLIPLDLGHGRFVSNTVAKAELKRRGLRPATIDELLRFGAQYPDEQRKYPIAELGSVACIHGFSCIAFLAVSRSQRIAGVLAWEDEWSNAMHFLATACDDLQTGL